MYNMTLNVSQDFFWPFFWLLKKTGFQSDLANQDLLDCSNRPIKIHLLHNLLLIEFL